MTKRKLEPSGVQDLGAATRGRAADPDRRRKFELPRIEGLSKEQEKVRALPREGQHLIVGGPGTGKSVLALVRSRRHQRERDDYLFLVFNHLLDRASGQLFGGGLASRTWDGWFRGMFRKVAGQPVPLQEPNDNGYREIDWIGVDEIIQALPVRGDPQPRYPGSGGSQAPLPPGEGFGVREGCPSAHRPGDSRPRPLTPGPSLGGRGESDSNVGQRETVPQPCLVIDEGQDMPREFYRALVDLGFERFFVVADQNQQITEANSSRQDIADCLDIETSKVIELRQNYRNQYRVARLAREFYTGNRASPPPELPEAASGPVPLLYSYEQDNLDAVACGILRLADRDPRQLIGVIAPKNTVRERYLDALRTVQVSLDNPRPPVETYHGGHRAEVAFDEGGILIINAQSCKGLEFDVVVLADVDEHFVPRRDPDIAKRLFYVMVARARERVFMFMKRGRGRDIERILPEDRNVLGRKEL